MSWLNSLVTRAVGPSHAPQSVADLLGKLRDASSADERRQTISDLKSLSEEDRHAKVRLSQFCNNTFFLFCFVSKGFYNACVE
jgi:hypothetical protein